MKSTPAMAILPEKVEQLKAKGISLTAWLDQRYKNKDGKYPVKLRIISDRTAHNLSMRVQVSPEDWAKIVTGRSRGNLTGQRATILEQLNKAEAVLLEMRSFNLERFRAQFKGERTDWSNVWHAFEAHAKELAGEDRISYSWTFDNAKKSFQRYHTRELLFDEVTVKWLKGYERWAIEDKGLSPTTVGINARCLRRLFNLAIDKKIIPSDYNPFGGNSGYTPPKTRKLKKALDIEDLRKLKAYSPADDHEAKVLAQFWFCFEAYGMNIGDMLRLKHGNITGDEITYTRHKTKSKREQRQITVDFTDHMQATVKKWGRASGEKGTFLFRDLDELVTEEQRVRAIKSRVKTMNDVLKRISTKLELPLISTNTARATMATTLKRNKVNIAFISEMKGHESLTTTEHYLAAFQREERQKTSKLLKDL